MRPSSGITFGGRYQLSSRIAIGGMGEVWQATDLVIGRTVAIKILKDEYLGDPGFLERFRAEARHAALVNHEGIANVFDYGEEDGSAYLVMELVPGEALSAVLERERVLSTDRVLDIVAQTASALQAAHMAGLVHRDIKPGNLLITPEGRVKITDFGIARIADQVPLTATGQVMGTVQYLSPEQASGHPASPTTDIYSLGIVAYEALAGRRPFTGESQVAIAMAQINEAPPELPVTISEPVRNLVATSIAKKPADRPATAAHLARGAQALRRGDVGGAIAAVPGIAGRGVDSIIGAGPGSTQATRVMTGMGAMPAAGPPTATLPTEPKRRNPWTWPLIAIVSVLAVVLIGIIVYLVIRPTGSTTPTPTPTTASATPTPSPTVSEPPSSVQLNSGDFEGRNVDEVVGELEALGFDLQVERNAVGAAPEPALRFSVTAISPSGTVQRGATIEVSYYEEFPAPPAPPTATASPSSGAEGDTITLTWNAYTGCPASNALVAYEFTLATASAASTTVPVGTTNLDVTLGAGTQATASYVAVCAEGIRSAPSANTQITIEP